MIRAGDPGVYLFGASCPRCGSPLVHENSSPSLDAGRRAFAIGKCPKDRCWRRYELRLQLIDFRDELVPLPAPETVE